MTEAAERLRILVADDESATRMMARALLERRGHWVVEAGDGAEAVAVVATADPPIDVALLDLNMPVSDGRAALSAVRADPDPARAGLAVIMLTGTADPAIEADLLDCGADAVLTKPLRWDSLAPVLRNALATASGAGGGEPANAGAGGGAGGGGGGGGLSPIERLSADLAPDKVRRLLDIAHANLIRHQADLRAAALCGDGTEVNRLAHKIAGVAGTYGCDSLHAAAATLERNAESLPPGALPEHVAGMDAVFRESLTFLQKAGA